MKMRFFPHRRAGFTLVELSIYSLIALVLSAVSFSFLVGTMSLTSKNSNLNQSHDDLRMAFDRLAHNLSASNNVPTLINDQGAAFTGSPTEITTPMAGTYLGPAAGLKFDQVIAEPYVLDSPQTSNNPLAAGSVAATATTLTVLYPKNSLTHVPHLTPTSASTDVSKEGFVLLVPKPDGTNLRLKITNVGARDSASTNWHKIVLTFSNAIGEALSWPANQPQSVKVVRAEAFIVFRMQAGSAREYCELRHYKNFEPMPTLTDPSSYTVLCNRIGIQTAENTPFGIVDFNGDKFVQSTLRVRERGNFNGGVAQAIGGGDESFYTYFQLHVNLPSRFRPRLAQ